MYCPNCGTFNQEWSKYCSICGTPLQEELSGNEVSPGTGGRNRGSEQSGSVKKKEAAGIGLIREMGRSTAYLTAIICFSASIVMNILSSAYGMSSFTDSIIDLLRMMDPDGSLQSAEWMLNQYAGVMGSAGFFSALLTNIPEILTAVGLWMLFLECRKKAGSSISASGFTIIYVIAVIKYVLLIIAAALFVIGGFIVIFGVSSAAGENSGGRTAMAVLIFLLVSAALFIIPFLYNTRLLKMISTSKQTVLKERKKAKAFTLVGVMAIISAVGSLGGIIASPPAGKLAALISGASSVCFAIVIFTYRDRLASIKASPKHEDPDQKKDKPVEVMPKQMQDFLKSDDYDPEQTIVEGFEDFIARKHGNVPFGIDPNATITDDMSGAYSPGDESRIHSGESGDHYIDEPPVVLNNSTVFDNVEADIANGVRKDDSGQAVKNPFENREKPIFFDRNEDERAEQERLEREQAERERAEQERLAREQAERERAEQERLEREQAERERAEQERLAREQAEREHAEQERLARERAERARAEQERLAREQAERERAEQERLAREQAERERAERERAEQERLAREQAERERAEQERLAREQAERERAEQERLAREQAERERAEQERLTRERAERARSEWERLERERVERERFDKEQEEVRDIKPTTVLNTESIGQPHVILTRKRNNMQTEIAVPLLRMGRNVVDVDYLIKDNPAIGRHHADIIFRDGTYYIIDKNSTNHVYIDGRMIHPGQETALPDHAEIQLADEVFVFQVLR